MSPKVGVVVTFHDDERHIEACLESLARQSMEELHVVIVDGGSSDSSAVRAKEFAERDPRFALAQGGGQAWGDYQGGGEARGDYLAFVRACDVVPPEAYEILVDSLEDSGSDLACGAVRVLDGERLVRSKRYGRAFASTKEATHITRFAALGRDVDLWNKVYRRSFWDSCGLSADRSVAAATAHLRARAVDVLDDVVYHRRERTRETEIGARMRAARAVCELLDDGAPAAAALYRRHVLESDLEVLLQALPKLAEPERREVAELGAAFVAGVDRKLIDRLPVAKRVPLHLLRERLFDELDRTDSAVVVTKRGWLRPRWYADHGLPLARRVFDVTDELQLKTKAERVRWSGGRLLVEGYAYINRLESRESRIRLWLREAKSGTRIELAVTRSDRPDVTAASNQTAVSYDSSGWTVEIDPRRLLSGRRWELRAEVVTDGLKRSRLVGSSRAQWAPAERVDPRVWAQPVRGARSFRVEMRRPDATVTDARVAGDMLELTGWSGGTSRLTLVDQQGGEVASGRLVSGRCRLPLDVFTGEGEWSLQVAGKPVFLDNSRDLRCPVREPELVMGRTPKGGDLGLVVGRTPKGGDLEPVVGRAPKGGDLELVVGRTPKGDAVVTVGACRPVADRVRWTDDGCLHLEGEYLGGAVELLVRHQRSAEQHPCEVTWADGRFHAVLRPRAVRAFGLPQPMATGVWGVFAQDEQPVFVGRIELPGPVQAGDHHLEPIAGEDGSLRLRVRPALADDERGAYAQERLRTVAYPAHRAEPLKQLAVFDSYVGRQYSCNPRAVYEQLRRSGSDLECVWVSREGQLTVPDGGRTVLLGSKEHYETMARARYIVTNEAQWPWFVKRPDQVYVQCWHGTPLKRLALDVPAAPDRRRAIEEWVGQEVPRWDVLVSPNPFSTPIMRQAYGYAGEILESGYPRNDLLLSPGRDRVATEVRRRLGIPPGKRVVLYAPTWRDELLISRGRRGFDLAFDLELARRALGEDHVLLLRTHYLITDRSWSQRDEFVVDVSRYPDIAELYLIADVLLTDYSSAMFDFAVTGKPMVFFVYDLERYRDEVRGFYFDFTERPPGPLTRTSEEAVAALRDLEAAEHAAAYQEFVETFCPYDDGHAADRVIARLLGPGRTGGATGA